MLDIQKFLARRVVNKPDAVARYYDRHTQDYLAVAGDVIQSLRPTHTSQLLDYLSRAIGLEDGMKVIDAGCGVAGPALHFAKMKDVTITGITISEEQRHVAEEKIRAARMEQKVNVIKGDYHYLDKHFDSESVDAILFLESLGHAADAGKVLRGACKVLKPGGFVYIKEFFRRETNDKALQRQIDVIVNRIDQNYCYNTLNLPSTISRLRTAGFSLDLIQRPIIDSDGSYTLAFEQRVGISTFSTIRPVDWYELKCTKPLDARTVALRKQQARELERACCDA